RGGDPRARNRLTDLDRSNIPHLERSKWTRSLGGRMRWILAGASTIAAQHMIGAFRANGDTVAHVVSTTSARAAEFAAEHGIPGHGSDLAAALADPGTDAVYISSTNEKHRAQALAAIAAGKHVLCEKPLAMTAEEAAEMVRAAEAAGVTFATNHHLRCSGSHRAVRAL